MIGLAQTTQEEGLYLMMVLEWVYNSSHYSTQGKRLALCIKTNAKEYITMSRKALASTYLNLYKHLFTLMK